jgi:tryptophan synthase alpha chain
MNRIDQALKKLTETGKKGLLPYLTAGLPDLETTQQLLLALDHAGVTAVELGFPYSDPVADGPTIQSSFTRVLEQGIQVNQVMEMVREFRRQSELPLLAMLSYSIVYRKGVGNFIQQAADAGFDGLILPDLSLEEAPEVARIASQDGLCLAMLISPVTPPDRWEKIAATSTGFVYYMSVSGITGERDQLPPELINNVRSLRAASGRPVIVGFGISKAEHVRQVCQEADGAIIGSALVRRIMEAHDQGKDTKGIVQVATEAVREWMTGLP